MFLHLALLLFFTSYVRSEIAVFVRRLPLLMKCEALLYHFLRETDNFAV